MKQVGEKIKQLRHKSGMTTNQLAAKLDISRSYLTQIENGIRPLPQKIFDSLVGTFRISPDTVYSWYLSQHLSQIKSKSKTATRIKLPK